MIAIGDKVTLNFGSYGGLNVLNFYEHGYIPGSALPVVRIKEGSARYPYIVRLPDGHEVDVRNEDIKQVIVSTVTD